MRNKLRFGLVGAGAIAQSYAQALATSAEAELVAIADVAAQAAGAMAETYGCKAFTSHRTMSQSAQLDAAIVCTPPASHREVCLDLLLKKVPVLCEKPLSVDSASARAITDMARHSGVKFTMASKFRYVEDVAKAKAIVNAGLLGEIILFENAFTSRVDMTNRWNSNPKVSGGGVLIDNGTHSVDLVRYFLGPVADVQVVEGKRSQGLPVEETVRIFVRSTAGVLGSIDLSWSINKEQSSYINIYGTLGTLWIGWTESRYRQSGARDWVVFGSGYNKIQAFRSNIDNFARAIRGEEALLISAEDALASVEVIEAAYADLRRSHWVTVGVLEPVAVGTHLQRAEGRGMTVQVHPTALVEDSVTLGDGCSVWDNVHIRRGARLGEQCIVGEKTYIAYDVRVGNRVKINAMVYICAAVTIEDGVMINAGTIFTNDRFPRATVPDLGELRPSEPDEETRPTLIREGATIGAGCTIGSDLSIGRFAMIGMGSLVTKSVPDFHLALGHPARSVGAVCRCGHPILRFRPGDIGDVSEIACTTCGRTYAMSSGQVTELGAQVVPALSQ